MEADPQRIEELIANLGSPDNDIQIKAESYLIKIGEPAVELLIEATKHKNSQVRWRSAYALGNIGDRDAFPAVLKLLADPDFEVRHEAVEALGCLGDPRAIDPLIEVLRSGESWGIPAYHSLYKIGAASVPALIEVLNNGSIEAKTAAIWALEIIGDKAAIEPIYRLIDVPELRREALEALAMLGDVRAIKPFISYVGDQNDCELGSLYALAKLGKSAVPALIDLLRSGHINAKQAAAWALGEIGDSSAIEPLAGFLDDVEIRYMVLIALGKCGDVRVLEALMEMLHNSSEDWDYELAEALGGLKEASVAPLIDVLKNSSPNARHTAAYALACAGGKSAFKPIIELLNDSDIDVVEAAIEALHEMASEDPQEYDQSHLETIEKYFDDNRKNVREIAAIWSARLRHSLGLPAHPGSAQSIPSP